MPKKCPPYRIGWDPDWLEEWQDKSLTWPGWDYDKKAPAMADAKYAIKSTRIPVVVYNGKLDIVGRFTPKVTEPIKPKRNAELIDRLRKEILGESSEHQIGTIRMR